MAEAPYHAADRRPIAARELRIFRRIAATLARSGVSANAISVAGMLCGIGAGIALAATACPHGFPRLAWISGAALIQLRLLANMLDGMVAIESGKASPLGEIYNEVPDRVSDPATLIGAGYAIGGGIILGYIAACVAMFTAYVRAVGKVAGAPQDFSGPMAKQQRMFTVTVIALYCGLTPTAWQPTWGADRSWGLMAAGLLLIILGGLYTAIRRITRIARALRKPSA